ncbi:MAG: hypothetical protein MJY60_04095 [Bacteroidales bacterium]|nr:hypothetical protein [Bacteroidales bacterium]
MKISDTMYDIGDRVAWQGSSQRHEGRIVGVHLHIEKNRIRENYDVEMFAGTRMIVGAQSLELLTQ